MEEGRLVVRRRPTDVHLLLMECTKEQQSWADQDQKRLIVLPAPAEQFFAIDAELMRRVLSNLISNAIKHTPAHTNITLGIDRDDEVVRIWVADEGDGIPPAQRDAIFEPYHAAETRNAQQANTGLGLTFCKLAVEAHGGTLSVESGARRGSVFVIALPLASARVVSAPESVLQVGVR